MPGMSCSTTSLSDPETPLCLPRTCRMWLNPRQTGTCPQHIRRTMIWRTQSDNSRSRMLCSRPFPILSDICLYHREHSLSLASMGRIVLPDNHCTWCCQQHFDSVHTHTGRSLLSQILSETSHYHKGCTMKRLCQSQKSQGCTRNILKGHCQNCICLFRSEHIQSWRSPFGSIPLHS